MFLDNPIFGQGPRSFRYLCFDEKFIKSDGICTTHPHNTYLQLLAETGLIGFFFVFLLFFSCLTALIKKFIYNLKYTKEDNNFVQIKQISRFISIITYLIYSLISNNINEKIYSNHNNVIFWLIVLFISSSEIIYFISKFYLIKITTNGSVHTNILDIVRRIITLIIGIFIFKDKYPTYLFICFGFLIVGCIFINFNKCFNIAVPLKIIKKRYKTI
jgi:magnesium-transporting ATPase (P-type)